MTRRSIPATGRRTAASWLLAGAFLAGSAPRAVGLDMDSRTESVTQLFRCVVPADWGSEALPDGRRGIRYSGGQAEIDVVLAGAKDPATPEAYLQRLKKRGVPAENLRAVTVSGKTARLWRRVYEAGGAPGETGEWVHEELVILPAAERYWVLTFRSRSAAPAAAPAGAEAWARFLAGFRLG